MNKSQVIIPLVALALVAIVLVAYQGRRNHHAFVISQTRQIGMELVAQINSTRLVRIGEGLAGQLRDLLGHPTQVAHVLLGDEPAPIGNGSADSRLLLTNANRKRLGIRLRQDSKPEMFHVLGYWNPGSEEALK